jgi:hypothetical protein
MSPEMNALTCISLVGLVLLLSLRAWKADEWRPFVLELGSLAIVATLLRILFGFPVPQTIVGKGATEDWALATALYVCMLAGMLSQYVYRLLERRESRRIWNWGTFVAPIFASPIVFIPLLASFEGTGIDLRNSASPRLMIFLVAFQNGFFWKEYFDNRRSISTMGRKEQSKP